MRLLLAIVLSLTSFCSLAGNSLPLNVVGSWQSDWVAVKGETQSLVISPELAATFTRTFKDGESQAFQAKIEMVDDLIIVKCLNADRSLSYKLVLSGWRRQTKSVLYGTMFMYRGGEQYNGLPVSFLAN